MTPAARYAGAIDVLDRMEDGVTAERALKAWGRENRYAGSKDRAAVRDHVFSVLRQKRSAAFAGGGGSARALVLGLLRLQGIDPNKVFGAGGYAPAALTDLDADMPSEPAPEAVQMDLPDWLWTVWQADLGEAAIQSAIALKSRGPISLRVNLRRGTPDAAIVALAQDGVIATRTANSETALQVTENERRIATSAAYLNGIVELQDLASQQAIAAMDTSAAYKILDYCAGGGGKALALVDISDAQVYAHDIAPERMVDLGPRADRAGVTVKTIGTQEISQHGPFDIVFCDAPCSGSGTWRRTPETKWVMTEEKLREFNGLQGEVIQNGAHHVGPSGTLVYATCSVLKAENHDVVERFLSNASDWTCVVQNQRLPDALGDGFYFAILQRGKNNL